MGCEQREEIRVVVCSCEAKKVDVENGCPQIFIQLGVRQEIH
jgi:hypothetical protein